MRFRCQRVHGTRTDTGRLRRAAPNPPVAGRGHRKRARREELCQRLARKIPPPLQVRADRPLPRLQGPGVLGMTALSIVVEGRTDAVLLKKVLPKEDVARLRFFAAQGQISLSTVG